MARLDLYRNVHKGQRARIFALAGDIGQADPDDCAHLLSLAGALRDALAALREHAGHEETFIHPVLRDRAPAVAEALEREHHWIEDALADVEGRVQRLETAHRPADMDELYRAWCRMVSAYLTHLDNEERLAMPALWERCTDEEIIAIMRAFVASRSAGDMLADLCGQAPALAPQEVAAYVAGVIASGKVGAQQIWHGLSGVLDPRDLARLRAAVAA